MKEHIGGVELDKTCYPGKEPYCDNVIEDELLEIVTKYPGEAYNQVIAEKKNWEILYHLSHIRANLVEWLPVSGEETVLEIGSDCGAITGILSKKAAKVDCIEASGKRSLINANRHKERENITIKIGDFGKIEAGLTEKYDWIMMIGVLAYAEEFADSETPHKEFLQKAASHLKSGGKVVLAIENRLGLKHFSGCEGYRAKKAARTFSKPELEKLLDEAGFTKREFYYPYPDYMLPMSIYSDEYLPKLGELNTNHDNSCRKQMEICHESEAFDSIIESGQFPLFSNSFLVVMEKEARDE